MATRKNSKMSETPNEKNTPTAVKVEKTYTVYNSDLQIEKRKVEVTFTPAATVEEALSRIPADAVLRVLNAGLFKSTLKAAKDTVSTGALPKKVVLAIASGFRGLPMYSGIDDRKKQTEAILQAFRQMPAMLETIRAAALASNAVDDDDETDEDGADE